MVISVDIDMAGALRGVGKLRRVIGAIRPQLIRGVDKATLILEREIKHQLSLGGRAPRKKGEARTKNPGVHLRVKDGTLRSSWKRVRAKQIPGGVEGHVASPVVYSAIHEFGGTAGRGVTIPARPYVAPAIEAKSEEMRDAIVDEVFKLL